MLRISDIKNVPQFEAHFYTSITKLQQFKRLDVQCCGDVEQQVEGDRAAEVWGFDGAHVLAADAHSLGQLLLGQSGVLAVVGDVVAHLNKLLRVVKFRILLASHAPHLKDILA